jgi:hypothetical protein
LSIAVSGSIEAAHRARIRENSVLKNRSLVPGLVRRRLILFALAGLCLIPGCPRNTGTTPVRSTRDATSVSGFIAVLYLNRTRFLIQPFVRLDYPGSSPYVNIDNITPESWEALLVPCGLENLTPLGIVPLDVQNNIEGESIEITSGSFTIGERIACGSVVVVEISEGESGQLNDLVIEVSAIPESFSKASAPRTSATAPGPNVDLILFYNRVEFDTTAALTYSWEDSRGLVLAPQLLLQPDGLPVGGLLECPIERLGVGNIADPNQAVVTIDNQPFDVVRPADLVMDETLSCGEAVTLTAEVSEDGSVNFMLEATVEGSDLAHTDFDLFGAIRQVIDDEGFAGRQSNVRFLSGN